MSFRWLKSYMPRSLYGRATLILLLPVITLLLVVSVVFIQRHFAGVTQQMVHTMTREIRLVLDEGPESSSARILGIDIREVPAAGIPGTDSRLWYDFSGIVVVRELRAALPTLQSIRLADDNVVQLFFRQDGQGIAMVFDRRRVSARQPHQLLVNMVVFGVLMTLVSYLYLRNQLRPITRLAQAAEAFGRGRNVPYRPAGAVEVRAAGTAFVDMRERIERQIEQRTLMLSGVSHDLRTPLTRLRLGLAMIDETDARPMLRDIEDMERLLDGFLDFARGARAVEAEPADPIALVRQVVEDARRAQVNVTLVHASGEDRINLRADSIRRAVENLINNAVRYGTRAEVSVVLTPGALTIRVEDDGPGIAPEDRDEAVRPFTRLDPARNQNRATGVGLGLSIVSDAVRAHGGLLHLGVSPRLGGLCAEIVIAR
ncbi:two-component system, OmpR family, osmolarity sensor histidine kinase EnvZ [Roseovarius azorensis]|uniref:histidine kinase n=1 Tax=Roseovarius azorensis TaxID=1287727 RepID=A0A1H7HHR2_9RHOB|nr:ATP-binding protein [Roseovarius azorensis]SEK49903.1 two-component system, OmpR family, osmolarity sensor histidine kinase EnvZ [Roseovarius azorensis]